MSVQQDPAIEQVIARQAIFDCLVRYTRGVDRMDDELLLSAYHEDATDTRGGVTRSPREFVDHLFPTQGDRDSCMHCLTNVYIDLDGDTAHVESYYLALIRLKERDHDAVAGGHHGPMHAGRYVDRFESRDREWKIASRLVIGEMRFWVEPNSMPPLPDYATRDRSDISYSRPTPGSSPK
jgi:hypothetical protein